MNFKCFEQIIKKYFIQAGFFMGDRKDKHILQYVFSCWGCDSLQKI